MYRFGSLFLTSHGKTRLPGLFVSTPAHCPGLLNHKPLPND